MVPVLPWLIMVRTPNGWLPIRPSGKSVKPYEYATKSEAEAMMRILYPDQMRFGTDSVRAMRLKWCPCSRVYDADKWATLQLDGPQDDGDGGVLELRRCKCGSTIAVETEATNAGA